MPFSPVPIVQEMAEWLTAGCLQTQEVEIMLWGPVSRVQGSGGITHRRWLADLGGLVSRHGPFPSIIVGGWQNDSPPLAISGGWRSCLGR
jgi:hypothetical protein